MFKFLFKRLSIMICILILFSFSLSNIKVPLAKAADECQLFKETGYTVCGKFLVYWRSHGALSQQGFPISAVFEERNAFPPAGDGKLHKVQYFQRARFEEHLENQPSFDVLLGLLGAEQYGVKYSASPPTPQPQLPGACRDFPETGFKVCGRFLEYWLNNGGLTQQGFPISHLFEELNAAPPAGDGKIHLVQYFQRARFEQHLENQPPFDVLLGLLGVEQVKNKYPLGTPGPSTSQPVPAIGCLPASNGPAEILQVCASSANPPKRAGELVSVLARLIVNGEVITNLSMGIVYHTQSGDKQYTMGFTNADGVAISNFAEGSEPAGFTIKADVSVAYQGIIYTGSTSFTPEVPKS